MPVSMKIAAVLGAIMPLAVLSEPGLLRSVAVVVSCGMIAGLLSVAATK